MPTGNGGTPPAAAEQATASCSRRHCRRRQGPGRTPAVRTPAAVSGGSGGQRTLAASSSAADRTAAPRPPSSRPDGIASWPQFPEAPRPPWQGPQAAGATAAVGGRAWMVGDRRPRCPRPAQGLRPCPRWTAAVRPAPDRTRPHPAVFPAAPRTLPRCPVPRTPAGFRARSARPADSDGPDARPWTRLVDTGSRRRPALRTPATVRRAASAPTRSRWQTASRSRSTSRTSAGSGLTWIGVDIKPGTYRSAGPLDGSSGSGRDCRTPAAKASSPTTSQPGRPS
jgi:hypothetical protein